MSWDLVWGLVKDWGPWGVVVVALVLLLRALIDEDWASRQRARLFALLFKVTGKTEHEKQYIGNDIRGRLNQARRKLHHTSFVLPRAVDVAWVEGGDGAAVDVKEGEFLVKLDPSTEQAKNIVFFAKAVVRRTTMSGVRHLIEGSLQTAIDLNLVRKLLTAVNSTPAIDWFLQHDYTSEGATDADTKRRNDQIVAIDERGLFSLLLLVEIEEFARRVKGKPVRPYMAGEIEGLVDFLYKIATRQYGEKVRLEYTRAHIGIGVMLVAKPNKLLRSTRPYINSFRRKLQKDVFSIYVMVFDKEWLGDRDRNAQEEFQQKFDQLDREFEANPVTKVFDVHYTCEDSEGRRRGARCIRYKVDEQE